MQMQEGGAAALASYLRYAPSLDDVDRKLPYVGKQQ